MVKNKSMKKIFLFIVAGILGFASCNTSHNETADHPENKASHDFANVLHNYYEDRLKLFPMEATALGDNRYNDRFPNVISRAYLKELSGLYSNYKSQLEKYDRNALSENDKVSYDVLMWECNMGLEENNFKTYLMPINQVNSEHLLIPPMADGTGVQPFKTVKDYDNWLKRLDGYLAWVDTAIVNMRVGMKQGYVIPKYLALKVIPQFGDFDHGPVESHMFYKPIKNMPKDFSKDDQERLSKAYADMIRSKIIPSYKKMKEFLEKEYIPNCTDKAAISTTALGRPYYDHLVKYYTTSALTAEQIFDIGEKEVARISEEMEKVKEQVGFKGDLQSFLAHLRIEKKLMPFNTPEEVIANFEAIHERMKPNLAKLFSKTPKTKFEIRRVPAFMELTAAANYLSGSNDGSRPGIFYVPIPNAKKHNVLADESLFLHEAIPGHHYQCSLQAENMALPEFRRTLIYNAYCEGWALYTESLGKELGLYKDPYQYFGMLGQEMHRALRLVIDAGLHTKGWTREQAIQYSMDHEAVSEQGITSEVERYIGMPGQALSYKIGQLKIREIRTRAEHELGNKFNIAAFHDQILSLGCLPLQLLEERMNAWIEEEKKK
jgi:uncharacterized protein (DUF885 family)